MSLRPTHAVIDLKALKHNYHEAAKRIPKNCGILCMVKADAYGHGAVPVAKVFETCGAVCLGVATAEEGIELRDAGIKIQILVMGGLWGAGMDAAEAMLANCLTPVVHSAGVIDLLESLGKTTDKKIAIHLKMDTGMSRLGVTKQALPHLLERLKSSPHLKLEGVMTHLAWRQNAEYTKQQAELFKEMGEQIMETLGAIPVWHIANSAAVMEGEPIQIGRAEKCWVRPGIMLYGIPPYPEFCTKADLQPVMSLASKVALIKHLPPGTKVSYNCTFTTTRPSRIGVIPIGYADGYPWSLANKGEVLVCGSRCPVLGRVTMDMIMVDLTDLPSAAVGSDVVLLGQQGDQEMSADALAKCAGTIPYEIVCGISKRMPRVYRE